MIDWQKYRRADQTLRLLDIFCETYSVYESQYPTQEAFDTLDSIKFLTDVEQNMPINSRQVAAVIISAAWAVHSRFPT